MGDADADADEEIPWEERWQMMVEFLAGYFFEARHFRAAASVLSGRGSKRHVIGAAARLLAGFGVEMSATDEQELAEMSEEEQINALLAKIPQDADGQFQHFFAQLQQLVVCSEKVRSGLEVGDAAVVEEAVEDANSFGIAHVVHRMAAAQAGTELKAFGDRLREWGKDNATKTGKLTRCQEEAMAARKKLAAAQHKLGLGRNSGLLKSNKFVVSFAEGSVRGLVSVTFRAWQTAAVELFNERRVAAEYERALTESARKLEEFKDRQVRGVRGILERLAKARDREAATDCLWSWSSAVRERKIEAELAQKLEEFQRKLRRMKESQALTADSLLLKACTYSESALMGSCFQAFVFAVREAAEEAACRLQLQKTQDKIDAYRKSKSATAQRILREMCCSTEAGLVAEVWSAWAMTVGQAREEDSLQRHLQAAASRKDEIRRRSKVSGHKICERWRAQREAAELLEVLTTWRLEARVEGKSRHHRVRVDAKRQQLAGVQTMFRSFAGQLESQLRESQSQKESRLYKSRSMEMGISDAPSRPAAFLRPKSSEGPAEGWK